MENTLPTHLDEYKVVNDEITLYQEEMHRTWLWAFIPAGAVYTWLSLHPTTLATPLSRIVWFIPGCFVLLCLLRYFLFWHRIYVLGRYLIEIENDAFGNEKNEELRGMAHFNSKHSCPKTFIIAAVVVWVMVIVCCGYLSWKLAEPHPALPAANTGVR